MGAVRTLAADGGAPRRGGPRTRLRRARLSLATVALLALLLAAFAQTASAEEFEKERSEALATGIQGYEYGQPLLDMERLYKSITSTTVPGDYGNAPVNQFSHFKALAEEKEGCVVAPNADTLYSIAMLKLNSQPIVMHAASTDRFNVAELLSPYTENFALVGQDGSGFYPPGNYVIAGPEELVGQSETQGMTIIHSPYNRVWIIGRTLVEGPGDLPNALANEEARALVPLNKWAKDGLNYKPREPRRIVTVPTCYTVPGTGASESPLKYWAALGKALAKFPPPPADAPILEKLARYNIGPGLAPTKLNSSKGTLDGLGEAVTLGPQKVLLDAKETLEAGFAVHNGWLVGNLGKYGTNYRLRVLADRLGVGAPTPNQAIYPLALTDRNGVTLNGSTTRYVMHFPATDFPVPVMGFWSLTMYTAEGLFVHNSLDRYTLGDRSDLTFNLDGSLDVYMQTAEPTNEAQLTNWLPAPAAGFHTIIRLYGVPEEEIPRILAGSEGSWQMPTILPCLASGKTAAGWNCAE